MNIGLVYATKTNHSKKIAETIAEDLKIEAKNAAQNPKLENVDLLFLVGGIYGGESLPEMLNYVKTLDAGQVKKAVLITSCVSKKMYQASVRKQLAEEGIKIMDEFVCQGSLLLVGLGHPNKTDIENAVAFARKSVAKLSTQSE